MKKHLQLKIRGRVQGVWYRASTQRKARELGLCGKVRNEADGSVYVEAEGEEASLIALVEWCKEGPPLASVSAIETQNGELKNYTEFTIEKNW